MEKDMNIISNSNTSPSKPTSSNGTGLSGFWSNLNLARKLLVAFGALAILALVVGVVANTGLNRVKNSYDSALSNGEDMQLASLNLSNNLVTARRHEKDFLLRWTVEGFDTAYANYVVTNQKEIFLVSTGGQQI